VLTNQGWLAPHRMEYPIIAVHTLCPDCAEGRAVIDLPAPTEQK
jgi:hypothetical protein